MALPTLQELLAADGVEEYRPNEPQLYGSAGPLPGQKAPPGFAETFAKSFRSGLGSTQYSVGQIMDYLGADDTGKAWKKAGLQKARENYVPYDKKPSLASLVDPDFYATTLAQNLPTMGLLAAAAATTGGLGTMAAGAAGLSGVAAGAVGALSAGVGSRIIESGMEAGQAYDDMIAKGRSEDEAGSAAAKTFWANMPMALVDAAQYALVVGKLKLPLKAGVAEKILARTPKTLKVAGDLAFQMGSEAGEEGYQEMVSRIAKGEPVALDDEMKMNMLAGAGMGGLFGGAGVAYKGVKSKANAISVARLEALDRNEELRQLAKDHNENVATQAGLLASAQAEREGALARLGGINDQEEAALSQNVGVPSDQTGPSRIGLSGRARTLEAPPPINDWTMEQEPGAGHPAPQPHSGIVDKDGNEIKTYPIDPRFAAQTRAAAEAERAERSKTRVERDANGKALLPIGRNFVQSERVKGQAEKAERRIVRDAKGKSYIILKPEEIKAMPLEDRKRLAPQKGSDGQYYAPVEMVSEKNDVGTITYPKEIATPPVATEKKTTSKVPAKAKSGAEVSVPVKIGKEQTRVAEAKPGIYRISDSEMGANLSDKRTAWVMVRRDKNQGWEYSIDIAGHSSTEPVASKAEGIKGLESRLSKAVAEYEAGKTAGTPMALKKAEPAKVPKAEPAKAAKENKLAKAPKAEPAKAAKENKPAKAAKENKPAKAAKAGPAKAAKEDNSAPRDKAGLKMTTTLHRLFNQAGLSVAEGLVAVEDRNKANEPDPVKRIKTAMLEMSARHKAEYGELVSDFAKLRAQFGDEMDEVRAAKAATEAPKAEPKAELKAEPAKAETKAAKVKLPPAKTIQKLATELANTGVKGLAGTRFAIQQLSKGDPAIKAKLLESIKAQMIKNGQTAFTAEYLADRVAMTAEEAAALRAKKKVTKGNGAIISSDEVWASFEKGKTESENLHWLFRSEESPQMRSLRSFALKMGVNVHFFETSVETEAAGNYWGNDVLINVGAKKAGVSQDNTVKFLFGHELGHHIAQTSPGLFNKITELAGIGKEEIEAWKDAAPDGVSKLSDAEVTEEIVCDLLGSEAQLGVLQKYIAPKAPSVWNQILTAARRLMARIFGGFHDASKWEDVSIADRTRYRAVLERAFSKGGVYERGRASALRAARREKKTSSIELTAEERKFNDAVVGDKPAKNWKELLTGLKDSAITHLYDDLYPLYKAIDKITPGGIAKLEGRDPYSRILLSRSSAVGKAEALLFSTEAGRKSFNDIVNGTANGEYEKLTAYALAMQCFDLARHDMPFPSTKGGEALTMDEVKSVVRNAQPHIRKAFVELQHWQRQVLRTLIGHRISLQEYSALVKKWPNYIPMMRFFENDAEMEEHIAGLAAGKMTNLSSPIHERKGSTRPLKDPLRMMVMNAYQFTAFAARNEAGMAIKEIAEAPGGENIFTKVGEAVPERGENGKVGFKQIGVTTDDPKKSIFYVWDNGQKVYYQTVPEIYRAISTMNPQSVSAVLQFLGLPAKVLRAGATLTPEFAVRNPGRDTLMAAIYSDYGFVPVLDTLRGVYHAVKKDDVYWSAVKAGAVKANVAAIDTNYLQRDMRRLLEKHNVLISAANPKNVLGMLQTLSEWMEAGTRIGEFKKAFDKTGSTQIAGLAGRSIGVDFLRGGTASKQANKVIAFFNAAMQGQLKMYEMFKKHPVRTSVKTALYITLPSVLLFLKNMDDDRYWELPQWQRDLFWIIPTKNALIRIPKPFELGMLFGSSVERMLAHTMKKDPEAFRGIAKGLWDTMSPGVIPTAMLPVIEWWANYSFFRERPIVPEGESDLPAALQYGPYTHAFSKVLGQYTGVSPRKVDNLVRGYSGGMGDYFMNLADWTVGVLDTDTSTKPAREFAFDTPGVKGFTSKPYKSAESIERFYGRLSELEGKWQASKREGKLWKGFDLAELGQLKRMRKIMLIMSDVRKLRLAVLRSGMDPERKRAQVDAFDLYLMNLARVGLGKSFVKVVRE